MHKEIILEIDEQAARDLSLDELAEVSANYYNKFRECAIRDKHVTKVQYNMLAKVYNERVSFHALIIL